MKINCGPTWQERHNAKKDWHRWFAWKPVRFGAQECRWLEYLERRGAYLTSWDDGWWEWEYRLPVNEGEQRK